MDRVRNKIIDITVSKTRDKTVFKQMCLRLQELGYSIDILCTDGYEAYASCRLAKKHCVTKAETALVESKNSLIRHYLSRFHRKTKRYTKAFDMILNSLIIFFNKPLLISILN
ncbi:MAG: IS1 family transposase [Alphaproteobacteria bacterium]|nr:IS1 family transposase [Alphaproteobacteria bacterium]